MAVGRPRVGSVEPARRGRPRSGRRAPTARTRRRRAATRPRSASQSAIVVERVERAGVHLAGLRAHQHRPLEVGQEVGAQPALVVGGHDDDPVAAEADQPERLRQRRVGALADRRPGARARRTGRRTGRPSRAGPSSASRAAARQEALATVAPVTNATPVPAGRPRSSTSHPRTTSCSFAATGDITGSAAFWSHALASHDAAEGDRVAWRR